MGFQAERLGWLSEDNNTLKRGRARKSRECGQREGWQRGKDKGKRGIVESKEGIHDSQWEKAKKVLL